MKESFAKFIETELEPGTLLIACGLPGTFKTETTEEVSKIKGYPILRTDLIRREVLKDVDIFDEKVAKLKAEEMNKLETRYAYYLELFKIAHEILDYKYEAIKFRLAKKTWYTPDFLVVKKDRFEIHEVKGFWEPHARVKIKVVAEMYPYFLFKAMQFKNNQWVEEGF